MWTIACLFGLFWILINYKFDLVVTSVQIRETRLTHIILLGISVLLVGTFYYLQPSYYFPHSQGVFGDNLVLAHFITDVNPYTIWVHHPLFPLISGTYLKVVESLGFLSKQDPYYYEKALRIMTVPARFLSCVSMILVYVYFSKRLNTAWNGFLVFLLFFTSYGVWIYSFHHHAISVSIPFQVITFILIDYWYHKGKAWSLIGIGFMAGLNVYLEIVNAYLALGILIGMFITIFIYNKESYQAKIRKFILFLGPAVMMAMIYYFWQYKINNTSDIPKLLAILADTDYQGSYSLDFSKNIGRTAYNILKTNLTYINNFYFKSHYTFENTFWLPVNNSLFDTVMWIMRTGSTFGFIFAILFYIRNLNIQKYKSILFVSAITSLTFFVGFLLRPGTSDHYYVLDTIPNLILIFALIYSYDSAKFSYIRNSLIIIFAFSGILYNVFSQASVYEGNDLNDHDYYRNSEIIFQYMNDQKVSSKKSIYFEKLDFDQFQNVQMKLYFGKKFENIAWITDYPEDGDQLANEIYRHIHAKSVFVGEKAKEILAITDEFKLTSIDEEVFQIEKK